ncbi:MAG: hypothetical protein R3C54_02915 [Parvularculaceae bacterium]
MKPAGAAGGLCFCLAFRYMRGRILLKKMGLIHEIHRSKKAGTRKPRHRLKRLARSTDASRAAPTLQAALDNWDEAEPHLRELAQSLEVGAAPVERFHERLCASPLPRSYRWADGSAYVNHVELVRKARNAEMPATFWTDPLMYQGGSDSFLGPRGRVKWAPTNGASTWKARSPSSLATCRWAWPGRGAPVHPPRDDRQ